MSTDTLIDENLIPEFVRSVVGEVFELWSDCFVPGTLATPGAPGLDISFWTRRNELVLTRPNEIYLQS